MAKLKKCKDCSHQISKKAKVCPSCGAPQPKQHGIGTLLVLGIFSWVVYSVATLPPGATHNTVDPQYPQASVDSALAALDTERQILVSEFGYGNQIWVQVKDDGTDRRGYAMYVCEVVREHMNATGIIVSVNKAFSKSVVTLGRHTC